jgi:hypothetical protein
LQKKLDQGDGDFNSHKEMIGFEFDGIERTLRLLRDKARRYIKETHNMIRHKSVPMKVFQTVVGKLRHATTIMPAAQGFFSPINALLKLSTKSLQLG